MTLLERSLQLVQLVRREGSPVPSVLLLVVCCGPWSGGVVVGPGGRFVVGGCSAVPVVAVAGAFACKKGLS